MQDRSLNKMWFVSVSYTHLGKDGADGLDIVWKGDLSTPPINPLKNWVYRDTDNGRVYIYNGTDVYKRQ